MNLVRNILREKSQKLSCHNRLTDHYTEGKWLEAVIEEAGERCMDEKDLFRTLSNSKQSIDRESNRDWWRRYVIWGFYRHWCKPNFQVTRFYLFVDGAVSPLVLKSRVRKAVGFNSELAVNDIECPQYPALSKATDPSSTCITKPPHHDTKQKQGTQDSHRRAQPHWTLDDTLQEVKSIVTLIENRIPQVPPLDVVIHFPEPESLIETGG